MISTKAMKARMLPCGMPSAVSLLCMPSARNSAMRSTVLGTLIVAIAAFYFGTNSVQRAWRGEITSGADRSRSYIPPKPG